MDLKLRNKMNLENTITVLETMRMICGLCRTEKEALDSAVSYLKTIQEENEEED